MPNLSPVKDKLKGTLSIYFWVLCWWNSVLEGVYSQGLSVGYGSNDNKLRIAKRWSGWFSLLIASIFIRDCHVLSSISWFWVMNVPTTIFNKKIWIYYIDKFTSIWNCVPHQYCAVPIVLCYIILHCDTSVVL